MKFTICTECKHLVSNGPEWYNNFCGAVVNESARDPFDGGWKYGVKTDTGRVVITNERHPFAREVNTNGQCVLFEPRIQDI